jgi:hypothetical protein
MTLRRPHWGASEMNDEKALRFPQGTALAERQLKWFRPVGSNAELAQILRSALSGVVSDVETAGPTGRLALGLELVRARSREIVTELQPGPNLQLVASRLLAHKALGSPMVAWVLFAGAEPEPSVITAFAREHKATRVLVIGVGSRPGQPWLDTIGGEFAVQLISPRTFADVPVACFYDLFTHEYFNTITVAPGAKAACEEVVKEFGYVHEDLLDMLDRPTPGAEAAPGS